MELLFFAALSLLSVVGGVSLIRKLLFWLYRPEEAEIYLGAVLKSADEAENTVRALLTRIRWMELGSAVHLMLVDKSGDPETAEIVDKIIADFPAVTLLSRKKF